MSTPLQRYYLQALQEEVICRFDSRKPILKTNICFEELSNDILKVTKIKITVPHLKRLFGTVKFDQFPPTHQLDVLANYIQLDSWEQFTIKIQQNIEFVETVVPSHSKVLQISGVPSSVTKYQELIFIIFLLTIALLSILV